ncbi:MAG TPA: CBS domain-containing protein [bacterium]|nr:CBS domain-containing protein [bacterium]
MSRRPMVVRDTDSIGLARSLMLWGGIRHLPVTHGVKNPKVVGVLSDRDVVSAIAEWGIDAKKRPVKDAMHSPVDAVTPDERVEDVAARLAAEKIGCLPVVDDGELVGIVTTTDVLADRALGPAEHVRVDRLPHTARDVMTADPETTIPEARLVDAAATMAELGVRHLPVIDADTGKLVGILSDRDVRTLVGDPREALESAERSELTVRDAMREDAVAEGLTTPISEIAGLLADERIGAVPIVDEQDHPVGIVSYVDLLGFLARQEGKKK